MYIFLVLQQVLSYWGQHSFFYSWTLYFAADHGKLKHAKYEAEIDFSVLQPPLEDNTDGV